MKAVIEGHLYRLENFEGDSYQELGFINKKPTGKDGELETVANGTTNEEVLEVLLDRTKYLNGKFPCDENNYAITHLRLALEWFNKRTQDRKERAVEGKHLN